MDLPQAAVVPEMQGQGIGSQLLEHFCRYMEQAGEVANILDPVWEQEFADFRSGGISISTIFSSSSLLPSGTDARKRAQRQEKVIKTLAGLTRRLDFDYRACYSLPEVSGCSRAVSLATGF